MKTSYSMFRLSVFQLFLASCLALFAHSPKADAAIFNPHVELYPGTTISPTVFSLTPPTNYQGDELYKSTTGAWGLLHLGAKVGADFLFLTIQARFDQYLDVANGGRFTGTLGQVVGGVHFNPVDKSKLKLHIYGVAGWAFGLGLRPQFPIDSNQISKNAITAEAEGLLEVPFGTKWANFFVSVVVGWHLSGIESISIADFGEWRSLSNGFHAMARAGFRFNFGL